MTAGSSDTPLVDREALRSELVEYPLCFSVIFGSHAAGTATAQSDIDIGVVFASDCPSPKQRELYLELHSLLAIVLETDAVDVTLLDDVPPAVGRRALNAYELLTGDRRAVEDLRNKLEATAPSPTQQELVERLDDQLSALDAALSDISGGDATGGRS